MLTNQKPKIQIPNKQNSSLTTEKNTNYIKEKTYNKSKEIYYTKPMIPLDFSFREIVNIYDIINAQPRKGKKREKEKEKDEKEDKKIEDEEQIQVETKRKKKVDGNQQEIIVEGKVFHDGQADAKSKKRKESNFKSISSTENEKLVGNGEELKQKRLKYMYYTNSIILHSNKITSLDGIDYAIDDVLPDVDFLNEKFAKSIFSGSNQLIYRNYTKLDLLQWIDLSHNRIEKISVDLAKLRYLKILYLHANFIQDLKEVVSLSKCPSLINLTLHGNPIEHIKGYRLLVIEMMPILEKLDFTLISEKELDIIHFKGAKFGEKRSKKDGKIVIYPKIDNEILRRMNLLNVNNDKKEM